MNETKRAGGTHNVIAGETTIVGTNGKIWGDVVAESADVAGRIVGNVAVSGILVLKATARLDGDVCARRLAIEPKATLNGKCVMIDEPES